MLSLPCAALSSAPWRWAWPPPGSSASGGGSSNADPLRPCGEPHLMKGAALGPSHKAIVDCRRRTVLGWTIAPSTAALQYMQDAADHPAIIHPLLATHVTWKQRRDPL